MLVAEGLEQDGQPARSLRLDPLQDQVAQLVDAHARGVDDEIGAVDQRVQQAPLLGDRIGEALARASQRVPAARFGVAPQQHLVLGVQVQDFATQAGLRQARHQGWN